MIFLLIPIAWLALVTPLLAACVMASRADAPCTPAPEEPASWVGEGLIVWDPAAAAALAARPGAAPGARLAGRPRARHGRRRSARAPR
ncbi:MAG TPA: hypothetical protein VKG38_05945 [Solirubrobacteraceae bacterium]|nr:hypothetical protein [Solirubrobacteraceae bacterium]